MSDATRFVIGAGAVGLVVLVLAVAYMWVSIPSDPVGRGRLYATRIVQWLYEVVRRPEPAYTGRHRLDRANPYAAVARAAAGQ